MDVRTRASLRCPIGRHVIAASRQASTDSRNHAKALATGCRALFCGNRHVRRGRAYAARSLGRATCASAGRPTRQSALGGLEQQLSRVALLLTRESERIVAPLELAVVGRAGVWPHASLHAEAARRRPCCRCAESPKQLKGHPCRWAARGVGVSRRPLALWTAADASCAGREHARRGGNVQGLDGQANVLQLANCVLALSPMNSVADQMSPLGSANEAL
jgi:hypothetical protein